MNSLSEIAEISLSLGCGLLAGGGEVSRAEDSARRVALALGAQECEAMAMSNFLLLTVIGCNGESVTVSRRARHIHTDFTVVERLNALSRRICEHTVDISAARSALSLIREQEKSALYGYLLSMMVSATFAFFFGGGWREALVSALCANSIEYMKRRVKDAFGNAVVFTFVSAFLCGFAAALMVNAGLAENYDAIVMGDIMLLIPGVSLVCSTRDLIHGDLLSGVLRLVETVLLAASLTAGFVLPSRLPL